VSIGGGPHGPGGAGPWPEGTGTIERPSLVAEHWWEEVLAYTEEGACCVITMHPFLSGRPGRARALGSLIDKIIQHGEIWLAPMGEIADRVMAATAAAPGPGCAKMPPGRKGRSSWY
jgi:hypothetical protein